MLLVGPGSGIMEGCLDQPVVCFGVGLRLSNGNIGEEPPVAATCAVTLGSPDCAILHRLVPGCVAHPLTSALLLEV